MCYIEQPQRDSYIDPLLSYFNIFGPPLDPNQSSYYSNITGFVHGEAKFHNITPAYISNSSPRQPWSDLAEKLMADVNMTNVTDLVGTWNWSASHKVALSVVEKKLPQTFQENTFSDDLILIHVRSLALQILSGTYRATG